jgi:membrane fusion protein (multidrug efflux system)
MSEVKTVKDPVGAPKVEGTLPKSGKRKIILPIIGLVVASIGGYVGYQHFTYVSTDDAMVLGQATLLSPKVSGIIVKADVQENQRVKSGEVLVEIKPDDYQNALDEAQSDMESWAAQLKGAELNYKRMVDLLNQGASTKERFDSAESQFHSLQRKFKSAEAHVNQAKLNLDYTKITAPADGKVGKKSFEVGMLAAAGQPLLGFVGGNERWVVANLKETDMDSIAIGQKTEVSVDAISGKNFEGTVESISPTTGATFSLLPPDNASGNFTKVVQRVPVRIKLTNLSEQDIDRLQSGLSAVVKIKIR